MAFWRKGMVAKPKVRARIRLEVTRAKTGKVEHYGYFPQFIERHGWLRESLFRLRRKFVGD